MTGNRLSFDPITARITAVANDVSILVSDCLDPQYLTKFAKSWPAIWVVNQRQTNADSNNGQQGLTGLMRQTMAVDITIRAVVQRYPNDPASMPNTATRVDALLQIVNDSLFGWKHPHADLPFAFVSSTDGPPYEAVCVAEVVFRTQSTYSRKLP